MTAWAIQKQEQRAENLLKHTLIHCLTGVINKKIKLNPSKFQVGLFINVNTAKAITLKLGRAPLTVSNEVKLLGLTFDRKLTSRYLIDNIRHRMWLRPIAPYGAPAYYSAAKTHINRIQVIQNSALRVALRRNRRTHIEDLHEEGSLVPLHAEAPRSSHRFMEKKVDDSLIQRLLIEHRIMLNYDRYRMARPSKTPTDLIPDYLELL